MSSSLRPDRTGVPRLERRDSYGLLLLMILGSLLLMVFSDRGPVGRLVSFSAIAITLLFALHTSEPARGLRRAALATVIGFGGVAVLSTVFGDERISVIAISAMCMLLVAATLAAILRRVAAHPRIDLATVGGALCVYLLLGVFFAYTYALITASRDGVFFAQTNDPSAVDLIYFSFITLSTTGYGDLSPGTNLGRMLAVMEAITGQLYLVSAVALVIGNLGRERPVKAAEEAVAAQDEGASVGADAEGPAGLDASGSGQ
jgi:Ion channel